MSHISEGELFESGANISIKTNIDFDKSLFQNYSEMVRITDPFIQRSYEDMNWYYIVCKPFDKQYSKNPKWFESSKFIDSVSNSIRKYCKNIYDLFVVKERDNCSKHHVNIIVVTPTDLLHLHDKNVNKFKYSCQLLNDQGDRTRVRDYIIKESKKRRLDLYKDYLLKLD